MKTVLPLLKKYGKTLLVILILGAGSYFHVDVTQFIGAVAEKVDTAVTPAPSAPDLSGDAGPDSDTE